MMCLILAISVSLHDSLHSGCSCAAGCSYFLSDHQLLHHMASNYLYGAVSNPMRQDSWPPGEACKSLAFIQQLPHMVIPCECSYAAISVYLCSFAAAANVNFSSNDSCCMVQMQYSHFLSHSVCYLDFKTQIHLSRVRYVSKCIVSAIAFQAPSLLSLVQRRLLCMFTALHSQLPPSSDTITTR